MRDHALRIFTAAIQAVQPHYLLPQYIQWKNEELWLGNQCFRTGNGQKIYIIGAGKASAAMAREVEIILGNSIEDGIIVTKYGHGFPLRKVRYIEAGHPVPDNKSLGAGNEIVSMLSKAGENDLVIALISGGASSLMADCPPGISLPDMQQVFNQLLQSGADIREMNIVRKHLSPGIKGGQLARTAYPATLVSFILSDVIGDPLDIIASGPTVPDPSSFDDAWKVLEKFKLIEKLPAAIKEWLQLGVSGSIPDTPKPADPVFNDNLNYLIGTNRIALEAAVAMAKELGYYTAIVTDSLSGEARTEAIKLVQQVSQYTGQRPACLLLGGETTVTIRGNGKGGRNQEYALAALAELQKVQISPDEMPLILSAGTDGTDGPTDAAGAVTDQYIAENGLKLQLEANNYLLQNDSYHFFQQTGGLIITGPTQTNVMDIIVVLIP